MDEWTGKPDREALMAMRSMIHSTLPLLEDLLEKDMTTKAATSPGTVSKKGALSHVLDCLAQGSPIRETLADDTRLHIDRPLPFMCVHQPTGELRQAAYDVSTSNASYLISPDIAQATSIINAIGENMLDRFGAFLVIHVSGIRT